MSQKFQRIFFKMLRGIFAGVLLTLCLLLEGSKIDAVGQSDRDVSGFSYSRRFPRIALSATSGQFQGYQGLRNTTAWRPKFGNRFVSLSQTTTLPSTSVLYPNSAARAGLLTRNGPVTADLDSTTYKLILTASGNTTSCQLDIQVDVLCAQTSLDLRGLGLVGGLIRLAVRAYAQIRETVASSLQASTSFSDLVLATVTTDVSRRVNLTDLCRTLVVSNSTTFPEPLL